ncbi:MAG: hypothetical protein GF341_05170 [candidate division Zixibacteria bacterium]|nr:hypothetical protein [candidate division Zixibacteria bacterium]
MLPIDHIIETLNMASHPEGGYFHETFRSAISVTEETGDRPRAASTAIYFLLTAGSFSAFHRVKGLDEVWHLYCGEPVEVHLLSPEFGYQKHILGTDFSQGQRPQLVIPAGTYQAAATIGNGYSLCGCTVAPGFEFDDLSMAKRDHLIDMFPDCREVIERFTRV